ncbi:hypothetical protein [Virgibacillus sediminis]|uniref:Uncharacterized protein n=1 Tax=Virgibacillus sediminis TaxID=202260 RepID=A0ABV7A8A3_9BACI
MIFLAAGLISFIGIMAIIAKNKINITTSAMAVVMSLGIVTQGVLSGFTPPQQLPGDTSKYLSMLDAALWMAFIISFIIAYFQGSFRKVHYDNPINRFGIGTWVAGTSICGILLYRQFPQWAVISEAVVWLNIGLWIVYMVICFKTLYEVPLDEFRKKAHGVLLLTTVSTQSMILLTDTVFSVVPNIIHAVWMAIGICFYLISSILILNRYLSNAWSLEQDWNNTNCILHGALSITGIAWLMAGIQPGQTVIFIWLAALAVFLLVEGLELYRMARRVKAFGIKEGILVYHVTQWSRVFTFAMFYTFTSLIKFSQGILIQIKEVILSAGLWLVLFLVILEVLLSLATLLKGARRHSEEIMEK